MSNFFHWISHPYTEGYKSIALIRLSAGLTFLGEGILKFLFASQGVTRFTLLGLPFPDFTAHTIGLFEIIGGICLLLGLFNNFFALLFAIEMVVALLMTKVSLIYGTSPLPLPVVPPKTGFWAFVHESRDDYTLLFSMIFLLIVGPGKLALDALFFKSKYSKNESTED